jgi:AcrR family transcriptional regulator
MESGVRAPGVRQVARDAVRAHVAEVALTLFAEHGFDEVTVEQISVAAGISPRSFHRYFAAKEDTVIGDVEQWSAVVAGAFAQRPADEPVWSSLLATYGVLFERGGDPVAHQKRIVRVSTSTPSLRARNLEKHLAWARELTPLVAARLGGRHAELRAHALVQSSLACFDVGLAAWADGGDDGPSPLAAVRWAFEAVAAPA